MIFREKIITDTCKKINKILQEKSSIWAFILSILFTGALFYILSDPGTIVLSELTGSLPVMCNIPFRERFIALYTSALLLPVFFLLTAIKLHDLRQFSTRCIKAQILSLCPLLIFIITQYEKNAVNTVAFDGLLLFSAFSTLAALFLFTLIQKRKLSQKTPEMILTAMFCAYLAAPLPALISNKLLLFFPSNDLYMLHKELLFFFGSWQGMQLIPSIVLFTGILVKTEKNIKNFVLLPIQFVMLGGYLVLLPEIVFTADHFTAQFPATKILFLVLLLFLCGCIESYLRIRRAGKNHYAPYISTMAVGAVICLYLFRSSTWSLYMNFYETGNRVTPYFAAKTEGMTYFHTLFTSFGFWDYFGCVINEYLNNGIVYFCSYGQRLLYFISVFLFFCIIRKKVILPLAIFFTYFMAESFTHSGHFQSFMGGIFLLLLTPEAIKYKFRYLYGFLFTLVLFPFFKYPQGCAFTLSLIPAGTYLFFSALERNKKKELILLIFIAFCTVLMLFTVFFREFSGLILLSLDSIKQNSLWSATTWNRGFMTPISILAANWGLCCPFLALVLGFFIHQDRVLKDDKEQFFIIFSLISTIWIFYFSCMGYSFARIDNVFSRQIIAGSICGILLISMFLRFCRMTHKRMQILIVICIVFLFSKDTYSPIQVLPQNFAVLSLEKIIDGKSLGMPSLGNVPIYKKDQELLINTLAATKKNLDKVLPDQETFINVSDFSMQKLFNRPQKLYYSEIFPVWGNHTQNKLLLEASKKGIRSVLFGQRRQAAQIYPIYRKALLSLKPVELSEDYTLMLHPSSVFPPVSDRKAVKLLEKRFSKDLQQLPFVWGKNYDALKHIFNPVHYDLHFSHITKNSFDINFSPFVSGKDASILILEISSITQGVMEISWKSELTDNWRNGISCDFANGLLLIPLDTAPSWLLSKKISNLKLVLKNKQEIFREEGQNITPTTENTKILKAFLVNRTDIVDL